jgi:hypothetical protein
MRASWHLYINWSFINFAVILAHSSTPRFDLMPFSRGCESALLASVIASTVKTQLAVGFFFFSW